MTGKSVSDMQELIDRLYKKYPDAFNQPDNIELFKLYLTKVLGITLNPLAEMRVKTFFWSTFERTCRLRVAKQQIKLSEENKQARHIEEEKTIKAIKNEKKNLEDMYDFLPDGRAVLRSEYR